MAARHPSDLSDPHYGYDVVVATTQASINNTMKQYLDSMPNPVVTVCYIAPEGSDTPTEIDYEVLLKKMQGVDPFEIPADVGINDHRLSLLATNRFMAAIRYRIGIPDMTDPTTVPDIVTLGSDTRTVGFNMLCSEFTICQYTPPGGWISDPKWFIQSQVKDQPWLFTSSVDMRQSPMGDTAFSKLPKSVQDQIHNIGEGMFSIQQLLFDLTNAKLESYPTISGVPPNSLLKILLMEYFINTYFDNINKRGLPLLGVAAASKAQMQSTLTINDFDFSVSPYVDPQGSSVPDMATLGYLCSTGTNKLPPPVKFGWNWVDKKDINDHDGVAVINRDTLLNWLLPRFTDQLNRGCFTAEAHCYSDLGTVKCDGSNFHGGNTAPIVLPPTGPTVLSVDWYSENHAAAGVTDELGFLRLENWYQVRVNFNSEQQLSDGTILPAQIIIVQDARFHVHTEKNLSSVDGDAWHKIFTDTYSLGVDGQGNLLVHQDSGVEDKSYMHGGGWQDYFTHVNAVADSIAKQATQVAESSFSDIPIAAMRGFVFPGGKDFIFKHVLFSDNQDMVAYISYADPTQGPVVVPSGQTLSWKPPKFDNKGKEINGTGTHGK